MYRTTGSNTHIPAKLSVLSEDRIQHLFGG
ncbi:Uncharacterised protein [Vibrio cholerae]|nr:Uncharacterised protein [Vibrio cholerae]